MSRMIRKIMRFINRHTILWEFFISFDWYKKELKKQAHEIMEANFTRYDNEKDKIPNGTIFFRYRH